MLHTNRGELNQLYDTFCRVWAAGGQATLTTSSSEGRVTVKLELSWESPQVPALVLLQTFNKKPQHLERFAVLAVEDQLRKLSLELGLLHTKRLQLLLHQHQPLLPRRVIPS